MNRPTGTRRHRRNEGGFTLIELLVVIAVLAVLAGIVIFNVVGVVDRGHTSACNTDKQTIQTAVDSDISDKKTDLVAATTTAAMQANLAALNTDGYTHSATVTCTTMTMSGTYATGFTVAGS
jgi:general secretion pathway protein G